MNQVKELLCIGFAGALGTLLRYGTGRLTVRFIGETSGGIPWGTAFLNILGCFLFGFLVFLLDESRIPSNMRAILLTGFLGGLTTFSAFAFDNQQFLHHRQLSLLALNMIGQNVFGVLAVIIGAYCALMLYGK